MLLLPRAHKDFRDDYRERLRVHMNTAREWVAGGRKGMPPPPPYPPIEFRAMTGAQQRTNDFLSEVWQAAMEHHKEITRG